MERQCGMGAALSGRPPRRQVCEEVGEVGRVKCGGQTGSDKEIKFFMPFESQTSRAVMIFLCDMQSVEFPIFVIQTKSVWARPPNISTKTRSENFVGWAQWGGGMQLHRRMHVGATVYRAVLCIRRTHIQDAPQDLVLFSGTKVY